MSSIETGDEGLSLEDFAASVIADLEAPDTDTATAPVESTDDTSTTEDTDTAEAPEVTEDATGRLHDKDGKFVAKPAEGEAETTTEEETSDEEDQPGFVLEVDDEETADRVTKYLEKYDGDVAKALSAAVEAQSLIGRKASEATQSATEARELREELVKTRELQQQLMARMSQPQVPLVPITRELIEEDPATAARQAVLQDNAGALEASIAAWRVENEDAANLFLRNLVLEAQLEEQRTAASRTTDTVENTDEVDAEVAKVLAKHPDLEQHLPAIGVAADANPLLKRALETGSPQERAQALEALTVIAKAGAGADTSREAMKRVQIVVKQEADEARRNATVVSASRSSAASASQPTKVDDFLAAFDARLGLEVDET